MKSLAAGAACGFVVSIPVGPLNLTVINQALRRGFAGAFLIGFGGICGEAVYAWLALAGHSSILDQPAVVFGLRIVALAVIAGLGLRYVFMKAVKLQASEAVVERVEERWHHPRSFLLGFALCLSNLLLLVLWATLGALLFTHDWLQPDVLNRTTCVGGVICGGTLWFFLLAWFVSRAHRQIKARTLLLLVRGCGLVLLGFAAWMAWKLF